MGVDSSSTDPCGLLWPGLWVASGWRETHTESAGERQAFWISPWKGYKTSPDPSGHSSVIPHPKGATKKVGLQGAAAWLSQDDTACCQSYNPFSICQVPGAQYMNE